MKGGPTVKRSGLALQGWVPLASPLVVPSFLKRFTSLGGVGLREAGGGFPRMPTLALTTSAARRPCSGEGGAPHPLCEPVLKLHLAVFLSPLLRATGSAPRSRV